MVGAENGGKGHSDDAILHFDDALFCTAMTLFGALMTPVLHSDSADAVLHIDAALFCTVMTLFCTLMTPVWHSDDAVLHFDDARSAQ